MSEQKITPKQKVINSVVELLKNENVDESIIEKVNALATTAMRSSTADISAYDADGNLVAIYCSYHKMWEPVTAVFTTEDENGNEIEEEVDLFGKAKTSNGYTRICKEGSKTMNTKARELRKAKDDITSNWLKGEIDEDEAKQALLELDEQDTSHEPRADGLGYATKEEAINALG